MRGRLAPSPTGALHLGNARSFLLAWVSARSRGGAVVLRVEDLDHPKVKQDTIGQALDDLRWLGLDWDEGPDIGGPHAPYVQSARLDRYCAALERLMAADLVYPCTCSRTDVERAASAPHAGEDGPVYPGTCRARGWTYAEACATLPDGRLPAWRFRAPDRDVAWTDRVRGPQRCNVARTTGDFVLARHPDGAGYQLAVVVDDAAMGVTEVLRGDDLCNSTARQILLQDALDLPRPDYAHVPLVVGPDGRRLAKRHGDTRLAAVRAAGTRPERVVGWLAASCGWADPGAWLSPRDLLECYDPDTLPRGPVVVGPEVLAELGLAPPTA